VEIDLLALKDDCLCLVEVKTRKSADFGYPEEFVDLKKQARLIRAAKLLSARKAYRDMRIRFDIVSVLFIDKAVEINHIENAFEE
jgi:putative endonuclease